jgi:hypothetical protein
MHQERRKAGDQTLARGEVAVLVAPALRPALQIGVRIPLKMTGVSDLI